MIGNNDAMKMVIYREGRIELECRQTPLEPQRRCSPVLIHDGLLGGNDLFIQPAKIRKEKQTPSKINRNEREFGKERREPKREGFSDKDQYRPVPSNWKDHMS